MRTLIVIASAILLSDPTMGAAQDAQPTRGFFTDKAVDFWRDGSAGSKAATASEKGITESIWAEPIRLPDGRYTTYLPPRPVLQFLEEPTRENGLKYLAWQSERMEKMRKAAAILSSLNQKAAPAQKDAPASGIPVSITYFKKEG